MRKVVLLALASLLLLNACGGGGGGSTVSGGGGGGGGTTQVIATPGPPNVEPLVMDGGPANALNTAFVTVKICAPGSTTTCQTIDHVEVDTGSSGLRILASALTITLPGLTDANNTQLAECIRFADGSSFGPLATADLTLPTSGESAAGINVQVIGVTNYTLPADCPGPAENTVSTFGANGILGVGPFIQDCGDACVGPGAPLQGYYYTCATPTTCADANVTLAEQVTNPVVAFKTDNNGVIVELPTPATAGASSLSGGALVFGIGTESNNALGSATVLLADPNFGFVQASFNGTNNLNAALDSGSNLNFFSDSSITPCQTATGYYCPSSTLALSATLTAASGTANTAADFSVANAETLFAANPTADVIPNLAGQLFVDNSVQNPIEFDLGIPFFFGRNIFTAIEQQATPGGTGPYFAY
jgi:hypothetical protein